jgi:hypothetical protein
MMERNIYFTLASEQDSNEEGLRRPQTREQAGGFNTVVPLFKARKIFFPIEKKTDPVLVEP